MSNFRPKFDQNSTLDSLGPFGRPRALKSSTFEPQGAILEPFGIDFGTQGSLLERFGLPPGVIFGPVVTIFLVFVRRSFDILRRCCKSLRENISVQSRSSNCEQQIRCGGIAQRVQYIAIYMGGGPNPGVTFKKAEPAEGRLCYDPATRSRRSPPPLAALPLVQGPVRPKFSSPKIRFSSPNFGSVF